MWKHQLFTIAHWISFGTFWIKVCGLNFSCFSCPSLPFRCFFVMFLVKKIEKFFLNLMTSLYFQNWYYPGVTIDKIDKRSVIDGSIIFVKSCIKFKFLINNWSMDYYWLPTVSVGKNYWSYRMNGNTWYIIDYTCTLLLLSTRWYVFF